MFKQLRNLFLPKDLSLPVSKGQKELLELLMVNKGEFETWLAQQALPKIRFQFFYPTAIDFHYDHFKLFSAFYKKTGKNEIVLSEIKMSETNFDTISCKSWAPFEEVIIQFLTTLEETKQNDLFEKRRTLFEYQSLCSGNGGPQKAQPGYTSSTARTSLEI